MDVLTVALTDADAAVVAAACDGLPHRVVAVAPEELAARAGESVLAAFVGAGPYPAPLPPALRHDAFAVAVIPEPDARATLAAVRAGYAIALPRGLDEGHVRRVLTYVATLAPPAAARTVTLGADGTLRAGEHSERLAGDVAEFLRAVGRRPGRVLKRDEHGDTGRLVTEANAALERVASGARVLKVAHVGVRFTGTLRE